MHNIRFLSCTKVELWDLTVCIAVNREKFQSRAVTLTLAWQRPKSNLSEIFSYTTMYSNFMFLDRLSYGAKNTETQETWKHEKRERERERERETLTSTL